MKTLEDLKALREKLKADMKVRQNDGTKIIIGMGTCGIAAGAREVMSAVLNELAVRKLNDVQVQQTEGFEREQGVQASAGIGHQQLVLADLQNHAAAGDRVAEVE